MKNNYPELKNGVMLRETPGNCNLRLIHNVSVSYFFDKTHHPE